MDVDFATTGEEIVTGSDNISAAVALGRLRMLAKKKKLETLDSQMKRRFAVSAKLAEKHSATTMFN